MTRYTRSMTEVGGASRAGGGWRRWLGVLAAAGCVVLLLVGTGNPQRTAPLRAMLTDASAPLMRLVAAPADAWRNLQEEGRSLLALRAENAKLREENARLLRWQAVAVALESENRDLRRALGYAPVENIRYITARVLGYNATPLGHTVLIDQGRIAGLRPYQAVIADEGLIGRLASVGRRSARVLLLTDMNARIPVIGEVSRERAVLAGDGGPMPRLLFVTDNSALKVGERLLSAADGKVIPAGIVVGQVFSQQGGVMRVELAADARRAGMLRVVAHDTALGAE